MFFDFNKTAEEHLEMFPYMYIQLSNLSNERYRSYGTVYLSKESIKDSILKKDYFQELDMYYYKHEDSILPLTLEEDEDSNFFFITIRDKRIDLFQATKTDPLEMNIIYDKITKMIIHPDWDLKALNLANNYESIARFNNDIKDRSRYLFAFIYEPENNSFVSRENTNSFERL